MPFFTLGSLIAQRLVGLSKQLWQKKKNEINITGLKPPSGWANHLAVL